MGFDKRSQKIILYGTLALLLILCFSFGYISIRKTSFTGAIEIDFISGNPAGSSSFNAVAYSVRGFPIPMAGIENKFRLTEKFRSYSSISVEIPKEEFDSTLSIKIKYRTKEFAYTYKEIKCWVKKQNGGIISLKLPDEISNLTGFSDKMISMVYLAISSIYWSGLYRYLSAGMILLIVLAGGMWLRYYLKKRKQPANSDGNPIKPSLAQTLSKWLLVLVFSFIIISHLILMGFSVIVSTTGPVLISAFFFLIIFLVNFLFKKKPSLRKNILLLFIVLYACILITEIGLRLSGITSTYMEKRTGYYQSPFKTQETGWYHIWPSGKPHYLTTPEYNFIRLTNSLGLSDKEFSPDKAPGEYRIIGIGDSFTEGDGADQDSTWLKFLERSLKKQMPGSKLTFYNAGVCGSDPFFEYVLLRDKLLKYKPDLVIAAFNDEASDILIRGGMERFLPDGTCTYKKPPAWEKFYAYSHIFRLIIHNLLHYDYSFIAPGANKKEEEKAIRLFAGSTTMFETLARENNFNLLIVIHPNKNEVNSHRYVYLDRIVKACNDQHINCLDLLVYYNTIEKMDRSNSSAYFWKYDGHHNAKGYAAFARGVEQKLREMGIVK